uniref:Uncharacterized protein n=1 Tax=Haemonchus contortus TaxID=6289 RepID=A0A7I4XWI5_HAECO
MSRSASVDTLVDDDDALVFPLIGRTPFSLRSSVNDSIGILSNSPDSSDSPASLRRTRSTAALGASQHPSRDGSVAYYRRFARFPSQDKPFTWMPSGKFTSESGKQKIIEYIRRYWIDRTTTRFTVEHICAVPLPGITRHKYAVRFHAGRYSSMIYFSIDVSTVYIKNPVTVTFTFPDSKRTHRLDTPRTHFDEFLRKLYPYGK